MQYCNKSLIKDNNEILQYFNKNNDIALLMHQRALLDMSDCGYQKHGWGCEGESGIAYAGFYNEEGKEMVQEDTYPYVMKINNYECQQKTYWNPGYKIDKAVWDYECSDEKMMKLIYQYIWGHQY